MVSCPAFYIEFDEIRWAPLPHKHSKNMSGGEGASLEKFSVANIKILPLPFCCIDTLLFCLLSGLFSVSGTFESRLVYTQRVLPNNAG